MLKAFGCRDGTLRSAAEPLSAAQWIDLAEPTPDEAERVAYETHLAIPTEADISEIESSSRLSARDGALYLSMPLVSRPDTEPR
jgi:magnesium transporter